MKELITGYGSVALILMLFFTGFFMGTQNDQVSTDYWLELRPDGYIEIQTDRGEVFTISADSLEEFIEQDKL